MALTTRTANNVERIQCLERRGRRKRKSEEDKIITWSNIDRGRGSLIEEE